MQSTESLASHWARSWLEQENQEVKKGSVEEKLARLFTRDPASYLIVNLLILRKVSTLEEIRDYLGYRDEFGRAVDEVVVGLEELDLVQVRGDHVYVEEELRILSARHLAVLLPQLFKIASNRVLLDASRNAEHRQKKESVYHATLPNDPDTSRRVDELYRRFKGELLMIAQERHREDADSLRFVGVVNSVMEPGDFI